MAICDSAIHYRWVFLIRLMRSTSKLQMAEAVHADLYIRISARVFLSAWANKFGIDRHRHTETHDVHTSGRLTQIGVLYVQIQVRCFEGPS
jgi:hypothetical protein